MVLLNIVFLLFLKRLTNPDVFKTFSLIDNVVHAVCNCFIPHPMEEWDEGKFSKVQLSKSSVDKSSVVKFKYQKDELSKVQLSFFQVKAVFLITNLEKQKF